MADGDYEFFMKTDLRTYSNEWIAIVSNKIVAHGKKARQVFDEAKKEYPKSRPLLAKVPGNQAMIL